MSMYCRIVGVLLLFAGLNSHSTVAAATSQPQWDNWYTVSTKGTPESYYNEKVVVDKVTIKIQVNSWIKSGKSIVTENMGAQATNNELIPPIRYNLRKTENGKIISFDGLTTSNGKIFQVSRHEVGKKYKPLRAEMLPKLILTSFFPVWVHKNYKRINGVQPIEFFSIVEDQISHEADGNIPVIKGSAYEMRVDDYAKSTNTRKLRIEFNQLVAFWWVSEQGYPVRITLPALEKEVKKVDQKTAQAFLTL